MKKLTLQSGLLFLFFSSVCQCQTVTDYDGNVYDTIVIGTQSWLKQNLRVTHYNDGVPIPQITDSATWATLNTGARCYYDNDSSAMDSVYGVLYNWYAVASSKKICPAGWQVPTHGDWNLVENFLGGAGLAGGKMKEAGFLHWLSPNTGATNSTGFTGLPGGARGLAIDYQYIFEFGLWWTYSSYNASLAWSRYFWNMNTGSDANPVQKNAGLSVRCIKGINIGMGEINKNDQVHIYPNPANSSINIQYPVSCGSNLKIFNLPGEKLIEITLSGDINTIDISALAKGLYIISITSNDRNSQQILIKE